MEIKNKEKVIKIAKDVLELESRSIKDLQARLDNRFIKSLEIILNTPGRIILTGMGKSGILGKKIASTFASTGTPAFFLHPGEGAHGDLGMLMKGDSIIAISYSGETNEIRMLLPVIKELNLPFVLITGDVNSSLAKSADVILDIHIEKEASPFGLIPTCSIAATLGIGDALAISLLHLKGFKKEDFAVIHPSGTLGYILNLKISDFMHSGDDIPIISETFSLKEALFEITRKGFGFTLVGEKADIKGIITDGDIRRLLEKNENILSLSSGEVMTKNPKTILFNRTISDSIELMEKFSITSLIVTGTNKELLGIVHLHDLLGRGKIKIGFSNET
ncbi:KpsF/GutQ family sugar-phosphate isomerase [Candidatus Dependentiae bacterium]|nr:KpsF/GutQ family sugar-phosphate isomerase [Candidatus Dependentiae bacterium]